MKKISIILMLAISFAGVSQTNYQQGMQKAFGLWQQHNNTEAINLFERIAVAEKDNWLPYYYAAQIEITSSFRIKDMSVIDANLKKGQAYLDKAKELSKDNAEILVLQALLYTVWVSYDGATYGREYSGKVSKLYKKAEGLSPKNPRVVYCKAQWEMGSAKFFGKDTTPYCKDLEKSIELFATFELPTPFHPNWGEERAKKILANCN